MFKSSMSMAETSKKTKLPEDCGYNKIFKYQWATSTYALPMTVSDKIQSFVRGRWGWHFIPHENMDYNRENWYENQTLILSFENKWDLVQARLSVKLG